MDYPHAILSVFRIYTRYSPIKKGKSRIINWALRLARRWPTDLVARTSDGRKFRVNYNEWTDHNLYFLGTYEPIETSAVQVLVQPGDVAIDIGANFGWYTTLLSQLVGPMGEVHVFEPVPPIFERLKDNLELMGRPSNVRVNNMVLSNCVGSTAVHWFDGLPSGHCSMSTQGREDMRSYECSTTTLDEYTVGLNTVQLIKCDVEGAECLVLAGAQRFLERQKKAIWLIEVTPQLATDFGFAPEYVLETLDASGYRFVTFNEGRWEWLVNRDRLMRGSTNVIAAVPNLHRDRLARLSIGAAL